VVLRKVDLDVVGGVSYLEEGRGGRERGLGGSGEKGGVLIFE